MKKEEILEKGKQDNKKQDPYELEVNSKASVLSTAAMLILALIYYFYESIKGDGFNPAIYSIISISNFFMFGYRALKIDKYRRINSVSSVIWGILTVCLILDYFKVI